MEVILFGTYNVRNGCNDGLELYLCGMSQVNFDLGLLQETNITDGFCTLDSAGFRIIVIDALICHRRGVTLFYKESSRFAVGAHQHYGPNTIIFQLVAGGKLWHVVGCFLTPHDDSTLENVIAEISQRNRGVEILVTGYFNTDL